VISRSTAFTYKDRHVPIRQIGEELQVHYVLEGSVLADADRLRVNGFCHASCRLRRSACGELFWSCDLHNAHRDARVMEEVTTSTGCRNVLVLTGSAAEEVAEFAVLSAEPVGRAMLLEAAHTSDPSLDPAMVLFKSIIQIDARPVADVVAQRRADRSWVGIMPVGCHPVRHKAGNRPCRAEEPLGRSHVTGRAQHRVDEVPVAIDRPIQVAPAALDLEVGFVNIPALARAVSCAATPLSHASPITGSSFASHCRTHSWLTVNPRNSMISLRSRSVSR
jgi:hypothetical protein